MARNRRIILHIDEYRNKVMEDFFLLDLPKESRTAFLNFLRNNAFATLEMTLAQQEQESKSRMYSRAIAQGITKREPEPIDVEVKEPVPNMDWEKMPLLLSKRDLPVYLNIPEAIINKWIKEGKINLRKMVGARSYTLTEEIKRDFPKLYNDLKACCVTH